MEAIPSLDHKADKAVYNIGAKRYPRLWSRPRPGDMSRLSIYRYPSGM